MATDAPMRSAGVHVPPPFLYVVGFVAGWLVHRTHPLPITAQPSAARSALALLFGLVWLVLMIGAFVRFRGAHTTAIPNRPASALVTTGVYRLTRNPMYVSLAMLYVALALVVDSWWPLVFLPFVLVAIDRLVIAREERYLTQAFPHDYDEYRRRVRRWL